VAAAAAAGGVAPRQQRARLLDGGPHCDSPRGQPRRRRHARGGCGGGVVGDSNSLANGRGRAGWGRWKRCDGRARWWGLNRGEGGARRRGAGTTRDASRVRGTGGAPRAQHMASAQKFLCCFRHPHPACTAILGGGGRAGPFGARRSVSFQKSPSRL
jgi:hypothetical protein